MSWRLIPVLALAVLAGCSKVHEKTSFKMGPGETHVLHVDPPKKEQKVQVVITSDQPINAFIILEEGLETDKESFDPEKHKNETVASEKGKKEITLNATIPGKKPYCVFFNGAVKSANVNVSIDSIR